MEFYYPPIELEQLRQVIVKNYNRQSLYKGKERNDIEFKEILFKLTALEERQVKSFAHKISSEHLLMLASYLPYNDYNIDLTNLLRTLEYRYRNRLLDASYRGYQFSMGNSEFFSWFKEKLLKNKNYKVSNCISTNELYILFTEENKVLAFAQYGLAKSLTFNQLLEKLKIVRHSLLANKVSKYYLILAGREIYLKLGSAELLRRTSQFTLEEYGRMLDNYLDILEINEFHELFLLRMYDYFEEPQQSKSVVWDYVGEYQKRKYIKWIGMHHMQTIFGNDVRTKFWKKYLNSVIRTHMHEESGRLALDFGKYVIVEFQQKDNAAFVYRSEDFYERYEKYFDKNSKSVHDDLKDKHIAVRRLLHYRNWQDKFTDELLRLGIRR